MSQVESTPNVGGTIHGILGRAGVEGPCGATGPLTSAKKALSQALGNTGFVNVVGRLNENFDTYLNRRPVDMEIEDLKPGMLVDVAAWVAAELAANADRALQGQARVRPEAAVKLLV